MEGASFAVTQQGQGSGQMFMTYEQQHNVVSSAVSTKRAANIIEAWMYMCEGRRKVGMKSTRAPLEHGEAETKGLEAEAFLGERGA